MKTRKNKRKLIELTPKQEAALIAYIVFYFQCDKESCWETIAEAIQEKGSIIKKNCL